MRATTPDATPAVSRTPKDIEEACRQIPRYTDEDLRRMRDELTPKLKADHRSAVIGYMIDSLIDEILRMRRDLRGTPAAKQPKPRKTKGSR